jgi:hypothetical protein
MVGARTAFDFFDGWDPIGIALFRQPAEAGCVSIGSAFAGRVRAAGWVAAISMGLLVFLFVMAPLPLMIRTSKGAASSAGPFNGTTDS